MSAPDPTSSSPSQASVRRKRKMRQASGGWWWKGLLALVILALVTAMGLQGYVKHLLQSQEFRTKIAYQLGRALHAQVDLPQVDWQDKTVRIPLLTAQGSSEAAFSTLRIEEISSQVELKLFQPILPIPVTHVSRVVVKFPTTSSLPFPSQPPSVRSPASAGGWGLRAFQKEPRIEEIRIQAVDLAYQTPQLSCHLTSLPVQLRRGQNRDQWALSSHPLSQRAQLHLSLAPGGKFILQDLEARVEPGRLEISQFSAAYHPATARNEPEGTLTLTGFSDAQLQQASWQAQADQVRLADWLPADWLKQIDGLATVKATLTGNPEKPAEMRLEAHCHTASGTIQGLPFLARLAEKTKTLEFTRLELNAASAKLQLQGQAWSLREILLESRGLLKLTGQIRGTGDQLEGVLEVGATPGRLRALDGAEQKIFTRQADGYLWADPPMRVWGSLKNLQEDLGPRLQDAWIGQKIDDVIDLANQAPAAKAKVLETGVRLLENAPGVIQQGARLLEGLFPAPR